MEWRPVVGYENYLEVSDCGQVKTVDRYIKDRWNNLRLLPSRLLPLSTHHNGYLYAHIRLHGKTTNIRVSRAVAMAFIPNPFNKSQVDHIDCNKSNNCVNNLRWVTPKENVMYADINGLNEKKYRAFIEKTKDPVFQANAHELAAQYHRKKTYCFSPDGKLIGEYKSCREAAAMNNCSPSGVSACCKKILSTLKGKIYSYNKDLFLANYGG